MSDGVDEMRLVWMVRTGAPGQQILQQRQSAVQQPAHRRFFLAFCRLLGAVLFTWRTRSKKTWDKGSEGRQSRGARGHQAQEGDKRKVQQNQLVVALVLCIHFGHREPTYIVNSNLGLC